MRSLALPKTRTAEQLCDLGIDFSALNLSYKLIADLPTLYACWFLFIPHNQHRTTWISKPTEKIGYTFLNALVPEFLKLDTCNLCLPKHLSPSSDWNKMSIPLDGRWRKRAVYLRVLSFNLHMGYWASMANGKLSRGRPHRGLTSAGATSYALPPHACANEMAVVWSFISQRFYIFVP